MVSAYSIIRLLQWFSRDLTLEACNVYRDSTGFEYDIIMARIDQVNKKTERYVLKVGNALVLVWPYKPIYGTPVLLRNAPAQRMQLYETCTASSYAYACHMTYSSPIGLIATEVLAPSGSKFEFAMGQFKAIFLLKTKIAWEERFRKVKHDMLTEGEEMQEERAEVVDLTSFIYNPPLNGPVGLLSPEQSVPTGIDDNMDETLDKDATKDIIEDGATPKRIDSDSEEDHSEEVAAENVTENSANAKGVEAGVYANPDQDAPENIVADLGVLMEMDKDVDQGLGQAASESAPTNPTTHENLDENVDEGLDGDAAHVSSEHSILQEKPDEDAANDYSQIV